MKTPRVKCLHCGCKTWHQPTLGEGQRQITKQFEQCQEKCILAAERFLNGWCRRANASGIRALQIMATTLRTHCSGLLNWYLQPMSSGPIEGINNKIGALQPRLRLQNL